MFESYAQEKILEKIQLSTLKNAKIAIDGSWYIKKHLLPVSEEHFTNPFSLLDEITKNIIEFNSKASVLWVWDGIEFRQSLSADIDGLSFSISNIIMERCSFKRNIYDFEAFIDYVTAKLRKGGIPVVRAPYSAAAQCSYFLRTGAVNYIFSKNDALLFKDCTSLLVDINLVKETADLIDREKLFLECNLNLESFRRLAFLSGCEYCLTHPSYASKFNPLDIIALMKKNTVADNSMANYGLSLNDKYYSDYLQGFYTVIVHPVMYFGGVVQCIDENMPDAWIEEVFGKRLDDHLYGTIFSCDIGVKAISTFIFNRQKPWINQKILQLFSTVFETPKLIDIAKGVNLSDFLARRFNIDVIWSPSISRMAQVMFHIFLENNNNSLLPLLKLLNTGILEKSPQQSTENPGTRDFSYLLSKYTPDNLMSFCSFLENYLILKDTVSMISILYNSQNDLSFSFTLKDFNMKLNKECLKPFLDQNTASVSKLDQFTQLLETN